MKQTSGRNQSCLSYHGNGCVCGMCSVCGGSSVVRFDFGFGLGLVACSCCAMPVVSAVFVVVFTSVVVSAFVA